VTASDADEVRILADRLHTVFTADEAGTAVDVVNGVLADAGTRPQVRAHDGQGWHLHYDTADARPLDVLAAVAAMGLAVALCTGGIDRLGRCDGIACRDAYVDTSRNNRRRFCSDGCANRAHVSAHRARQRQDAQ
jgi:predicted RNA-binding Zn ribbon-like protein